MNIQLLSSITAMGAVLGATTYQMGNFSTRMLTVEAESKTQKDILFDIHGKVCGIEKDIKYLLRNVNKDNEH